MPRPQGEITRLLSGLQQGKTDAENQLAPLIYAELRRIARHHFRHERLNHTLQPTALVHEAYLRLMGSRLPTLKNRAHFYRIASKAMRRILVEHARSRNAAKRGGRQEHVELDEAIDLSSQRVPAFIALDEALTRLEQFDPRQAQIVELRFFGGMSVQETAKALGVGITTVKDEWRLAKAWLRYEMENA